VEGAFVSGSDEQFEVDQQSDSIAGEPGGHHLAALGLAKEDDSTTIIPTSRRTLLSKDQKEVLP
jgi:DNA integrity scanning protein DisA with diadenylate cyclase activity